MWINRCVCWDAANEQAYILRACHWRGMYFESAWINRRVFWEPTITRREFWEPVNEQACVLRPCECTGMYFETLQMTRFVFSDLANVLACIFRWPDVYFETQWMIRCVFWEPVNDHTCILKANEADCQIGRCN